MALLGRLINQLLFMGGLEELCEWLEHKSLKSYCARAGVNESLCLFPPVQMILWRCQCLPTVFNQPNSDVVDSYNRGWKCLFFSLRASAHWIWNITMRITLTCQAWAFIWVLYMHFEELCGRQGFKYMGLCFNGLNAESKEHSESWFRVRPNTLLLVLCWKEKFLY